MSKVKRSSRGKTIDARSAEARLREVLKFRKVVARMAERRGLRVEDVLDHPAGPQSVVPDPRMTELRHLLGELQASVQLRVEDLVVKSERVARHVDRLGEDVRTSPNWDALTRLVLECVVDGEREMLVKLVPVLRGKALDAAAFALALGMKRELLDGKQDDDAWFRTRLLRKIGEVT